MDLKTDYLEDLNVISVGMEEPRCYYIPFAQKPRGKLRTESEQFLLLDGQWAFRKYDHPLAAERFLEDPYTETIPVPSCVQYYGYDEPQYSGGRVTFPFMPPHVPRENPIYCYRRNIGVTKREGRR